MCFNRQLSLRVRSATEVQAIFAKTMFYLVMFLLSLAYDYKQTEESKQLSLNLSRTYVNLTEPYSLFIVLNFYMPAYV